MKSVRVVQAGGEPYLADSAHTHVLPSRVARRPVHHGLLVAVEEVLPLRHAVELARVLRCGQRASGQITRRPSTFGIHQTPGKTHSEF